jgi:transposase-like protein
MLTSNGTVVASPVAPPPGHPARPDPEVRATPARARRRQFTAADKLRILHEADHCAVGHLGALLRREGLYSSHLTNWRRQRAAGALTALAPRPRGRPAPSSAAREVARLREENARLARQLAAAQTVIEVQGKVSALLGLGVPPTPSASPTTPAPRAPRVRNRRWRAWTR